MKQLKPVLISGKEVAPLVEGGKGVAVSNGISSGAWAAAGGVGTFSAVNADRLDANGEIIPLVYKGQTRRERHEELIAYSIEGGISQARSAYEVAGGNGRIHMNVLWEMAASEQVLHGVLSKTKGLVHGVTCGAGMPFRIAPIAARYEIYYYPIVSSARAFKALWKRSYHKYSHWLGGVVYEDPWRAGGHNGLSNSEDPKLPGDPYPRVAAIRSLMNEFGLQDTPIFMAGGVWYLREWQDWLDNPEIGPIAFQFGTRPLLTQESPISDAWKNKLLTLKEGDVFLNHFSPTGFYSSAVNNAFLQELQERNERQIAYVPETAGELTAEFLFGVRKRLVYVTPDDKKRAEAWIAQGYNKVLTTPESTLIFVTAGKAAQIRQDQIDCMGCLSQCRFSNWACNEQGTTGRKSDPRSFCIQKTLQEIAHGADPDKHLMFAGHSAYRFATDPFYADGFIPSVRQLVDRLLSGD